jgi:hypothetical protein
MSPYTGWSKCPDFPEYVAADTTQANILWRFNNEVKSDDSTEIIMENRRRLPVYIITFGLAQ